MADKKTPFDIYRVRDGVTPGSAPELISARVSRITPSGIWVTDTGKHIRAHERCLWSETASDATSKRIREQDRTLTRRRGAYQEMLNEIAVTPGRDLPSPNAWQQSALDMILSPYNPAVSAREVADELQALGHSGFVREFRTMRIQGPRRAGHTTLVEMILSTPIYGPGANVLVLARPVAVDDSVLDRWRSYPQALVHLDHLDRLDAGGRIFGLAICDGVEPPGRVYDVAERVVILGFPHKI